MKIKEVGPGFPDMEKIERLAKEAFPPEEYLAPSIMLKMAARGEVDFWGLYDEENFVGFMVVSRFENMCYLFFLAIDPLARSKGYGGQALGLLESLYPGRQQVVDIEMVDAAAANNAQRQTRRAFYLRNGYMETGRFISYRGVDYEILCRERAFDFGTFRQMMESFRGGAFQPVFFER